jgi:hypothetical protein
MRKEEMYYQKSKKLFSEGVTIIGSMDRLGEIWYLAVLVKKGL